VTAVDADFGQRVEHVIDRGEYAARPHCGLPESAEVQPDYIAFGGECRSDRAPHPPIGDAGMEKDDRQVTARARTVVGDTGGRSRTRSHGFPPGGERGRFSKALGSRSHHRFRCPRALGRSPRWQRSTARCSHAARTLVDGRQPGHTHRGANCFARCLGNFPQASQ
jgi:hypothetical protein